MDSITFQQIEVFISIAETLSFSKSSKVLFISQPSLSRMISRLERALDTRLFNRNNRGVTLTLEGKYLYNELLPVYHKMRLAFHNVQNIHKKPRKMLRIGCHTVSDMMDAFDGIRKGIESYKRAYPEVEVVESVYEFKELRQALIFNEVDIIFSVSIALEDMSNVTRKHLSELRLYIAMSERHPLAKLENVDLKQLNKETFFFPSSRDTQTKSNNELEQCM